MNGMRGTRGERVGCVTPEERKRFEVFTGDLSALGRRPKTLDSYHSDWLCFAVWWNGRDGTSFDSTLLEGAATRQYKAHLVAAQMTPATVNRKLVFLKRYSDWLVAEGVVDDEARRGIRAVEPISQSPRRPHALNELDVRRFLKVVDASASRRDQAIIYLFLQAGLRVSELVALERGHLVLGPRSAMLQLDDERSGRPRERRIPVGPEARRRLRAYLDERGEHDGPLFEGERGPLTANGVQRMVRKYCGFAQVQVSPQTLRHTFATAWLDEHDDDLVGLAEVLGHETLETTRLYLVAQRAPGRLARAPARSRAAG